VYVVFYILWVCLLGFSVSLEGCTGVSLCMCVVSLALLVFGGIVLIYLHIC
jgi:hypothetical protein